MSRLAFLSTIFVLILVFVIPIILTFAIRFIPNDTQPSLGDTKKIYGKYVLSQSFISLKDNLSGIGISIKNPNFANKKNTYVNIYDENHQSLRSVVLNGQNIADGKFVKIMFAPINNSSGKKYSWTIASAESIFDDALEVFLTKDKPSWSLDFKVNDELDNETLSYITLHKVTKPTEVINRVLSGGVNKLLGDITFFTIYSMLILSLLGYLFNQPAISLLENLKRFFAD